MQAPNLHIYVLYTCSWAREGRLYQLVGVMAESRVCLPALVAYSYFNLQCTSICWLSLASKIELGLLKTFNGRSRRHINYNSHFTNINSVMQLQTSHPAGVTSLSPRY